MSARIILHLRAIGAESRYGQGYGQVPQDLRALEYTDRRIVHLDNGIPTTNDFQMNEIDTT